jgi:uncharacterized protein YjbI with pentapeptide repeats
MKNYQVFMSWFKSHKTRFLLVLLTLLLTVSMLRYECKQLTWAGWTGFGKDENKSIEKTFQNEKLTTIKEITTYQSAKNLWDWLGLAGVIAIPIVLFRFQQQQQQKSEKQAEVEKEIAAKNLREEALQNYIDKIAELLIDKKLKLLLKHLSDGSITKDDPELDAALDVARARTLSILRRLDGDVVRKGSVVRFLIDTELIENLDLLKDADLNGVDLSGTNLSGTDLSGAKLSGAILLRTNLSSANLSRVWLKDAKLIGANLAGANLSKAILLRANLLNADLTGTNFSSAYLREANLYGVDLKGANFSQTRLESVKNLTPDMVINNVINMEQGVYDPDFRHQLGLPPESLEDQKSSISTTEFRKMLGLEPEDDYKD